MIESYEDCVVCIVYELVLKSYIVCIIIIYFYYEIHVYVLATTLASMHNIRVRIISFESNIIFNNTKLCLVRVVYMFEIASKSNERVEYINLGKNNCVLITYVRQSSNQMLDILDLQPDMTQSTLSTARFGDE